MSRYQLSKMLMRVYEFDLPHFSTFGYFIDMSRDVNGSVSIRVNVKEKVDLAQNRLGD